MISVIFLMLLVTILLAISVIDCITLKIPNILNLSLAMSGGAWAYISTSLVLYIQLLAALFIIALLLFLHVGYSYLRNRNGIGMGDIKMAGASSIWITPQLLPTFFFIASAAGLIFILIKYDWKNMKNEVKIPFGPFLAIGLFTTWTLENFIL